MSSPHVGQVETQAGAVCSAAFLSYLLFLPVIGAEGTL